MLTFPNAKINLGLNIIEKRPDGYHNLETVFYPVLVEDALEITLLRNHAGKGECVLNLSGKEIGGCTKDNLVVKAYQMLNQDFGLPSVEVNLLKHIPLGAGLGGGSSDAAFMLKMLNEEFGLNLSEEELQDEETKTAEVCTTIEKMLEDGYCSAEDLPATALAWDLVRAVNMARWTHLFGYISEEEMWQTMQAVAQLAEEHFASWGAYGLSFVLGRGAWQGDTDQCEGAYEIVSTLLEKAESPWMQFEFNPSNG